MYRLNLIAPRSWQELTQEQLRFLLQELADVAAAADSEPDVAVAMVETTCLLRWNSLHVVTPYGDGAIFKRINPVKRKRGRTVPCESSVTDLPDEFYIDSGTLAAASAHLSWIRQPPETPVRLDVIGGATAVVADLSEGFTFSQWLYCENLWHGYCVTRDAGLLRQMAEVLYNREGLQPDAAETLSVFYWWAGVKALFTTLFPDFFKPTSGEPSTPDYNTMRRANDSQIRALTKGDITKEEQVNAMPVWRALTELDALARDYEEINRKFPKS